MDDDDIEVIGSVILIAIVLAFIVAVCLTVPGNKTTPTQPEGIVIAHRAESAHTNTMLIPTGNGQMMIIPQYVDAEYRILVEGADDERRWFAVSKEVYMNYLPNSRIP